MGVIYVKENQFSEEHILDNNENSPLFDEFLQTLGDKVRLRGFDKYKGGLDTVHDLTGISTTHYTRPTQTNECRPPHTTHIHVRRIWPAVWQTEEKKITKKIETNKIIENEQSRIIRVSITRYATKMRAIGYTNRPTFSLNQKKKNIIIIIIIIIGLYDDKLSWRQTEHSRWRYQLSFHVFIVRICPNCCRCICTVFSPFCGIVSSCVICMFDSTSVELLLLRPVVCVRVCASHRLRVSCGYFL